MTPSAFRPRRAAGRPAARERHGVRRHQRLVRRQLPRHRRGLDIESVPRGLAGRRQHRRRWSTTRPRSTANGSWHRVAISSSSATTTSASARSASTARLRPTGAGRRSPTTRTATSTTRRGRATTTPPHPACSRSTEHPCRQQAKSPIRKARCSTRSPPGRGAPARRRRQPDHGDFATVWTGDNGADEFEIYRRLVATAGAPRRVESRDQRHGPAGSTGLHRRHAGDHVRHAAMTSTSSCGPATARRAAWSTTSTRSSCAA